VHETREVRPSLSLAAESRTALATNMQAIRQKPAKGSHYGGTLAPDRQVRFEKEDRLEHDACMFLACTDIGRGGAVVEAGRLSWFDMGCGA